MRQIRWVSVCVLLLFFSFFFVINQHTHHSSADGVPTPETATHKDQNEGLDSGSYFQKLCFFFLHINDVFHHTAETSQLVRTFDPVFIILAINRVSLKCTVADRSPLLRRNSDMICGRGRPSGKGCLLHLGKFSYELVLSDAIWCNKRKSV